MIGGNLEEEKLTVKQITERFNAIYVGPPYRGYRVVSNKARFIVDQYGQRMPIAGYRYIGEVHNGFRVANFYDSQGNLQWTYLTYDGRQAFDGRTFETALDFHHGLARVKVNNSGSQQFSDNFYYINIKGQDPFIGFEQVGEFYEGFAIARRRDGQYVFVNMLGSPLIQGKSFDLAWPFQNGFAQVMIDGEKFQVTHTGRLLN